MTLFRKKYNGHSNVKESISTADYLKQHGVSEDAIVERQSQKSNLIEDFLVRKGIDEDALRTVEGRKGAELKHRLTARMILLSALIAPIVVIPFWLMWILSPTNSRNYSERMQAAFLAALASDVLGLCWIVTRDLFPQGNELSNEDIEGEKADDN
ncbi:hypothetical protein HC928_05485 [bacterium]|nr:hypothetical protein [bacterium]